MLCVCLNCNVRDMESVISDSFVFLDHQIKCSNATTNHTYFVPYIYIILLHIFTLFCTKGMVGQSSSSSSASLDTCSPNVYLFVTICLIILRASLCRGTVLGLLLPFNPFHFYTIIIYKIDRLRPDILLS